MVPAKLRRVPGCGDAMKVTISPVVGRGAAWSLTTSNSGRAEVKRCNAVLGEIVARLQDECAFVEDPVRPMPRRL